jgi:hypothetical protein
MALIALTILGALWLLLLWILLISSKTTAARVSSLVFWLFWTVMFFYNPSGWIRMILAPDDPPSWRHPERPVARRRTMRRLPFPVRYGLVVFRPQTDLWQTIIF